MNWKKENIHIKKRNLWLHGQMGQIPTQGKLEDLSENVLYIQYRFNLKFQQWKFVPISSYFRGPEPTRYGDWERKGRVTDF